MNFDRNKKWENDSIIWKTIEIIHLRKKLPHLLRFEYENFSTISTIASLTVRLVRFIAGTAVVQLVALQLVGDAESRLSALELIAARPLNHLRPHRLEPLGAHRLVGGYETEKIN